MSCGCNDSQSSNRDIVVDLNKPHLRTVAVRPTKANPDIRVVVGQGTDGHYEPKEIIYPGYYSPSEIQEKGRELLGEQWRVQGLSEIRSRE